MSSSTASAAPVDGLDVDPEGRTRLTPRGDSQCDSRSPRDRPIASIGAAIFHESTRSIRVTTVHATEEEFPVVADRLRRWAGRPSLLVAKSVSESLVPLHTVISANLFARFRSHVLHSSKAIAPSLLDLLSRPLEPDPEASETAEPPRIPAKILQSHRFECRSPGELAERVRVSPAPARNAGDSAAILASILDFGNLLGVRAVAGLASFLRLGQVPRLGGDRDAPYDLTDVRVDPLDDVLFLDSATVLALQIVREERHPSVASGSRRGKEGVSLFSLLDRTRTTMGRELLRHWCLLPSTSLERIRERLDTVEACVWLRRSSTERAAAIEDDLAHVKDMGRLLHRFKHVRHTAVDWRHLRDSVLRILRIAGNVEAVLRGEDSMPSVVDALRRQCVVPSVHVEDIRALSSALEAVIDWSPARRTDTDAVRVASGVDETLDDLRELLARMPQELDRVSEDALRRHPQLRALRVDYLPQIGCVLVLEKVANGLGSPAAVPVPHEWSFQFETPEALHFRSPETTRLDETFGDIHTDLRDVQAAVMRQVEVEVLAREAALLQAARVLGVLDAFLSLASVAEDHKFVRPDVVEEPVIEVEGGRHPLVEMVVDRFVANDVFLSAGDGAAFALVTGPNASGKSILLKQTGLLCYMAQIGSFVPASRARIGVVDRILARFHTRESAALPQGAFAADLAVVSSVVRDVTPRSLVLLDEFGKGTNSVDGAALLGAVVNHLLQGRGVRALVSTHFRELFDDAVLRLVTPSPETASRLRFFHMEVLLDEREEEAGVLADRVVPLFQLREGRAPGSYGLECARRAGVPEEVLERAAVVRERLRDGEPILPLGRSEAGLLERPASRLLRILAHLAEGSEASDALVQEAARLLGSV